ncbi:hypothetical protein PF011_g15938 [Phytophthora fragariae]|nr:hypothetical protein PF011_g15938 [Phytophthora fragariae]
MQVVELKDLGVVSKFLGVAFSYDEEDGWALDQEQVIQDMLVKFGLDKAVPVSTPIGGEQDGEAPGELLPSGGAGTPGRPTVQTFQSLVGSLLWISSCTRPDISFAVHRATRNSHAPREADWRLAKRIAKYLKGTKSINDADYAADKTDRKSVSGGVVMMAGAVVAWMCKKQACVALSTMESEFVAASHTTARMLGVIECLKEIGIKVRMPSLLHVDNQAAIAQLEGGDTTGHAKHIDTRHKFVKDFVKKKVLLINYCESKKMRVDVLTKVLPAPRLAELRGLVMPSG